MQEAVSAPPTGYTSWEENLKYRFNWQAMKLLSVICGGTVATYKQFAEQRKPFVDGSTGFFKMNLYPIGFKKTSSELWLKEFSGITGFLNKKEYVQWCQLNRFKAMRQWSEQHRPKLIICLGKTYREEFFKAFSVSTTSWETETIAEREISWAINDHGSLVVVLPFMLNPYGLVKNESIQQVGKRIASLQVG